MSYQNKQPHYHRITLLFTSTGITEEEAQEHFNLTQTEDMFNMEIENWDEGEPGDPADLL